MKPEEAKMQIQSIPEKIWNQLSKADSEAIEMAFKTLEKEIPPIKPWETRRDCKFCRDHEQGDTLYESSHWDGGLGFDYIRDIKYCPICGRILADEEQKTCL